MSVSYDPRQNKYYVCPTCGPYVYGYSGICDNGQGGNYTVPNCYGGTCSSGCKVPHGPYIQCPTYSEVWQYYTGLTPFTPSFSTKLTPPR